jgi:hypothetical protein
MIKFLAVVPPSDVICTTYKPELSLETFSSTTSFEQFPETNTSPYRFKILKLKLSSSVSQKP